VSGFQEDDKFVEVKLNAEVYYLKGGQRRVIVKDFGSAKSVFIVGDKLIKGMTAGKAAEDLANNIIPKMITELSRIGDENPPEIERDFKFRFVNTDDFYKIRILLGEQEQKHNYILKDSDSKNTFVILTYKGRKQKLIDTVYDILSTGKFSFKDPVEDIRSDEVIFEAKK